MFQNGFIIIFWNATYNFEQPCRSWMSTWEYKTHVFPDSLVDSLMPQVGYASSSVEPVGDLCTLPERLHNTLLYRGSTIVEPSNPLSLITTRRDKMPSGGANRYFPNATEVLFKCLSAYNGKKTTWKIVCQDGVWVGRPHNCGKYAFW